jgi:RNA ligase
MPPGCRGRLLVTVLADLFDEALLVEMIEAKMVRVQLHDTAPLAILNYTAAAQYSQTWNEVTRQCRGLIVQSHDGPWTDREVIARPFAKFFNLGEHGPDGAHEVLPAGAFEVLAKMDGSLGILYTDHTGQPAIATRGSFHSEQAEWATAWYRRNIGIEAPDGVTLLFEIIYPSNRIVVDYGDNEGLVLLAAIDNATGADVALPEDWPGDVVERFDGLGDIEALATLVADENEGHNSEGFVLRFAGGPDEPSTRVKAKFVEYVRLHRIVTGITAKTIWEHLSTGRPLTELIDRVPDEFYSWVLATSDGMLQEYGRIQTAALQAFEARPDTDDRRTLAEYFQPHEHRAILFKMLDGRDHAPLIWRAIKPAHERPFRTDEP